jgi:rubrerythrin
MSPASRPRTFARLAFAALTIVLFTGSSVRAAEDRAPDPATRATMENLQKAHLEELSARAAHLAFSKKADQEGFREAANFLRAAARSEEIHEALLAEALAKMGGTPADSVGKRPIVKSTRENLDAVYAMETRERDTMYPGFLLQARTAKNSHVTKVFGWLQYTESQHAFLATEMIDRLENPKPPAYEFLVCSGCGNLVVKVDFLKCPGCDGKEKYEEVP